MKKRGFGTGKWNGFGGKIEKGETAEQGIRTVCSVVFLHCLLPILNESINDTSNGCTHICIPSYVYVYFSMHLHKCMNIYIYMHVLIGAIRELEEESSLIVSGENMLPRGYIVFNMKESKKIMKVHVYESWYSYMYICAYIHESQYLYTISSSLSTHIQEYI